MYFSFTTEASPDIFKEQLLKGALQRNPSSGLGMIQTDLGSRASWARAKSDALSPSSLHVCASVSIE